MVHIFYITNSDILANIVQITKILEDKIT